MIIIWIIKLLLIVIPYHFYTEFQQESQLVELARNPPLTQIVYYLPINNPNDLPVTIKVTYPNIVITGEQYKIKYELENYSSQQELLFDMGLKAGNISLTDPILFEPGKPVLINSTVKLDGVGDSDISFEPIVTKDGYKFVFSSRQIKVYVSDFIAHENFWKWADLALMIITGILWLILLISV